MHFFLLYIHSLDSVTLSQCGIGPAQLWCAPAHTRRETFAGWAVNRGRVSGVWRAAASLFPEPSLPCSGTPCQIHTDVRWPQPVFQPSQAPTLPSASVFPSAGWESACKQGEVLYYSTRVCYNPTQWCSCCLPTWMQPFCQVTAIPSARNKQVSRTPSHDREIIISLLCSQPK